MRQFFDELLFDRRAAKIVGEVKQRRLTYLSPEKIAVLVQECRLAYQRPSGGLVIECGCALGGSAAIIARLRPFNLPVFLFDTFEGMPPSTETDTPDVHARYDVISSGKSIGIGGDPYYGYRNDLELHVRNVMNELLPMDVSNSVTLVRGLVQNTLPRDRKVSFAHIDVDWYEPVKVCAETLFPNLEVGGSLIFDDYSDYESCKLAVNEYFDDKKTKVEIDKKAGSCRVRRVSAD